MAACQQGHCRFASPAPFTPTAQRQ
jgi:hypothetical protein